MTAEWLSGIKSVLLGIAGFCFVYWSKDLARRHIDMQNRFWGRLVIAVTESNVLVYQLFILLAGITLLGYSIAGMVRILRPQ